MINPSETIAPQQSAQKKINAAETIAPGSGPERSGGTVLLAGESIADSYVVNSAFSKQGTQANVYLAKKWGKTYVVKVYHNGWHPSDRMQGFLTSVRHPNIAHVIECGERGGNYYEIYEYYSEGTLEDKPALSANYIQNTIVPSINEGLHELHRHGIVHCDIKPSNLFFDEDESRVVIGDCGISGYTNSTGKFVDSVRGTPEYAPRVKSLMWSAAMSPAYDYGSFGLVLCRAILGHSLFEGLSVEEINRCWERGLELPSQISGRLLTLIRGLLTEDEEKRWGYMEVKRWCEGEYMRPQNRSLYTSRRVQENKPLIFGRFDGQMLSVNSLHQLAKAIREHWDQGTKVVKRRETLDFIRQYDKEAAEKVRSLSLMTDADAACFKLLLLLDDDYEGIFFKGREYSSLADYVDQLAGGRDEVAKQLLSSGLLITYLKEKDFDRNQVEKLEQLIKRNGTSDMAAISTICFALQGKKSIDVFGTKVDSLDDLVPVLSKCSIQEIAELIESDKFIAWANRLGYEKEMRRMKGIGI